jgi:hypothetical protein
MKIIRLALICAFITTAMVNQANADGFKGKPTNKVINLTLEQAIQVPGLVAVMLLQLDESLLNNNQQSYTVSVRFNDYTVRVTGSYEQWAFFFKYYWSDGDRLQRVGKDIR